MAWNGLVETDVFMKLPESQKIEYDWN